MRLLRLAACAVAPLVTGSCWPGWDFLFDVTPSREHRVEDLRVLAVRLEPASIVFTPQFAQNGGAPFELRIQPLIFDPRGGEIDVDISLCIAAVDGFSPCTTVPGVSEVRTKITADADEPLGLVDSVEETFTLSHDVILAMFDAAGLSPTAIGGMRAGVVVNVGRTFDGKRERERAELLFPLEVDPFAEGTTPELFDGSGGADCGDVPDGACFPGNPKEAVCGDGVVEGFEQCDPPEEGVCDAGCFAFDFCQAAAASVCVEPVTVNTRPVITGAFVFDEAGLTPFSDASAPRIDVGGVIELTPGVPRFVTAESSALFLPDVAQPVFQESFCPEGSPGRRTFIECGLVAENVDTRVYIGDQRAELVGFTADEQFFGNPQSGGGTVGVMFAADTPSGTREPLILVVGDGSGGMDLALFILAAR